MHLRSSATLSFIGALVFASPARPASVETPAGLWDATVHANDVDVPFRFEVIDKSGVVKGWFFNGDEKVVSTDGRFADGILTLEFAQYGAELRATFVGGSLDGNYDRGSRPSYPFHAVRFVPPKKGAVQAPSIAGAWNVQVKSSKGESAWRLFVRQSGADVTAAILRVDGDTGTLTGSFQDGAFVLSHFSGARPSLFELKLLPDGRLSVLQNRKTELVATRDEQARTENLPQPSDPTRFTTMKDPTEPLRFAFPGLDGALVTNADPRFRDKVVLLSITGSWCPNCHDEAPFLAELYRTYHARGLEIVAFAFEEADQLKDPVRLRAFISQYHLEYPFLLAGEPEQLAEKLPQLASLNSFPTTILIGRDGQVRGAHAGFAGRASGRFHADAKREMAAEIERLLAEHGRVRTTSSR